ncbi:hypothetical protein ABIE13_003298 [Ottowia thiooxydans]|uniref:Uncharacterized protein n=1 Tax=Ottowia thiooxydans TaxID=219182 RepID=A0ABV2QB73_9BURK
MKRFDRICWSGSKIADSSETDYKESSTPLIPALSSQPQHSFKTERS